MRKTIVALVALSTLSAGCTERDDDDGFNLHDPMPAGQVRAGVIDDPRALLAGFRADGQVGDLKLYNSRAAFVVQSARRTRGFFAAGGSLLDAAVVNDGATGPDRLQQIVPILGVVRYQDSDTVELISDGRDGIAIVRASGVDRGHPILDSALPSEPLPAKLVTEYRLRADAPYLEITTTVHNQGSERLRVQAGDAIIPDDSFRLVVPGNPLDSTSMSSDEYPLFASVGPGTSLGFAAAPGQLWSVPLTQLEVMMGYVDRLSITAGSSDSITRYLILGRGDLESVREGWQVLKGLDPDAALTLSGTVAAGNDLEGVEVFVLGGPGQDADRLYTHVMPGADGRFEVNVDSGEYSVIARGPGRPDTAPQSVTVAGSPASGVSLPLGPPGYIEYHVTARDLDGSTLGPSPCRLMVQDGLSADFNDRVIAYWVSASGDGTQRMLPGTYTVSIARGFEFGMQRYDVTLAAGQTVSLTPELTREVDTAGYVAADFHSHSQPSIDSTLQLPTKVASQVADGLELVVTTDHDAMLDLQPAISAAGLEDRLKTAIGVEISPLYGHSNAFPLTPTAETRQYYGVSVAEYDDARRHVGPIYPPATWDAARGIGARVIQVNHPRSFDDYFNFVGLDAETGEVQKPEAWSTAFDALEVFNGLDSAAFVLSTTLPDWYGMLNRGENHVATGNSDQHQADHTAGNARNYVAVDNDDPASLDPDAVFDSLLAFRAVASSGPFIRFSIDGHGMGETFKPAGATVSATLHVEAAGFVPVDYVRIVGNGEVVFEETFDAMGGRVVYDQSVELTPQVDTWYHAIAGHTTASPRPLGTRGSLALTNPVWVDLNGDGFDPPN